MDIENEKAVIIERLQKINDRSLLKAIGHLVDYGLSHNHDIASYSNEIEKADQEIEKGEFLVHDDAIAEIRSWREK